MRKRMIAVAAMLATCSSFAGPAVAEILAMVNYESKTPDALKALNLSGQRGRQEGIMVIDVDPKSDAFGRIIMDIPLPPDLVAHHIFYDRTMTKAYLTALGKPELHVIDMTANPFRIKRIDVPECQVGEDLILSEDNSTWYLTCMGSSTVIVGDVRTDTKKAVVKTPMPYPHGLALHTGIDRYLVTSTVRPTDLGDAGETISVFRASTNEPLGSLKLSDKPSPAGVAPVEILFVPGASPPVAYITNMYGGTLWTATWDPRKQDFTVAQAYDFNKDGIGMPLEIYVNDKRDRLYVTTAKPGHLHVFDIGNGPGRPKLLKTIQTAAGAHHVAITRDGKLAFVQNALLNLPGMSDGAITVVDLETQQVIASVDTLKDMGYNPNSIVLLPEWSSHAGH